MSDSVEYRDAADFRRLAATLPEGGGARDVLAAYAYGVRPDGARLWRVSYTTDTLDPERVRLFQQTVLEATDGCVTLFGTPRECPGCLRKLRAALRRGDDGD